MLKAILMYLGIGPALIIVSSVGLYIGLVRKYGADITLQALRIVDDKYLVDRHNWFEALLYAIIGVFITWPLTLHELPLKIHLVHKEAELLMDSGKKMNKDS